MKQLKLAVVGKDVSGSVSPQIQSFIAGHSNLNVKYDKLSVGEQQFDREIPQILKEYDGINVTIPYKLRIIPYLNATAGDAKLFGAVNTVNCHSLIGYNTDGLGFKATLESNGISVKGQKVLVLGIGGAGRTAAIKMQSDGAEVYVYNRTAEKAESLACFGIKPLKELAPQKYKVIVNATGVGMHKTVGQSPAGKEILSLCDIAFDLIYNPPKSKFLQIAEECGKKIINGGRMLFYQAYYAQRIFFGLEPDGAEADRLYKIYTGEQL